MILWSLASICFVQIAFAGHGKVYDEGYNYCKNDTYLDTRRDGSFRCLPCSTCPSWQYERSPCQKNQNTFCAYCSESWPIQNDDWREKCESERKKSESMRTGPPTTTEGSRYCGPDMWYKEIWGTCLRCSKCDWDEYEYESCSRNRDTTCNKCWNYSYPRNWDWRRKCPQVLASTRVYWQPSTPVYNWRYYEHPYWEKENRTAYNCSTPFENFDLTGLLSCYFSTLVQWTFIVSLIIFSCCCLTAYKICTSCFSRKPTLQQHIDRVRLLSPDELQVLQQATQMIKEQREQKAKENNFENPNFQETV